MMLADAMIAVVAAGAAARERLLALLSAEGAQAQGSIADTDSLTMLATGRFDAIVFDVGDEPARFIAVAEARRAHALTRDIPVVLLAPRATRVDAIAGLATGTLVAEEDGSVALLSALVEAIAERRAADARAHRERSLQVRVRALLERLAQLRSDNTTLAHDARALFNTVVGAGCNLRDGFAGPLNESQAQHVGAILEAAGSLTSLVERYSSQARAQPTEVHEEPEAATQRPAQRRTLIDLTHLARTTAALFQRTAAQKRIALRFVEEAPVSAWCNEMQLKQVVTNLVVNAIKFTPAGGAIELAVQAIAPTSLTGPGARKQAALIVSDSGPGIAAADRERVFERGVRLERDAAIEGTGIGLAVVREVVQQHGGQVEIGESPSGGARFTVMFPLDMRSRARMVMLLRGSEVQGRLHAAFGTPAPGDIEVVAPGLVAHALEDCEAVAVVARATLPWLDELVASRPVPAAAAGGANK